FSFNHSPIISAFSVAKRQEYFDNADQKCSRILSFAPIMIVLTVMFFVFSCLLSLSPQNLQVAKFQNISILSYLANFFLNPMISFIAPLVAFISFTYPFL
ncbi:HAAAP family serine/threonine permease, partial [Morganella morganii]|nr:HAAAP family serine/threonine permease [Morganella morganii]